MFNSFEKENKPLKLTMNQGLRVMRKMQEFDPNKEAQINEVKDSVLEVGKLLVREASNLYEINSSMLNEVRLAAKTNPFKPLSEQEADTSQFESTIKGANFINIVFQVVSMFDNIYADIASLCNNIVPGEIISSDKTSSDSIKVKDTDDLKDYIFEYQLNEGAIKKYIEAIYTIDNYEDIIVKDIENIFARLQNYYAYLKERHVKQGVKVFEHSIVTDMAYAIFENVDAHGEIQSGTSAGEVSAYTMNKGLVVVKASENPIVAKLIQSPDNLIQYICDGIDIVYRLISSLKGLLSREISDVKMCLGSLSSAKMFSSNLTAMKSKLKDVNPGSIVNKGEAFISQDEKFSREYEEETIKTLVEYIILKENPGSILKYVLDRKESLKKHFQDENTFYVCQISQGNPFLGESPGALKVIPGKKPSVDMDQVVGSGFDAIRDFYHSIEAGAQWAPLFIATSPSKSTDKSNCLMVGPPGCGKTELMRAIGGHKDCIGIFAQGSDFLTCWKGEAEKNPKRLFEQALQLHKESKKRVYILIDEIDAVMHKPEGHNDVNLTLEFQILMDGIVSYPGISVWGATNNPERMPMAMIRRFNKVEIVGELDSSDRVSLLKLFLGHMPMKDFKEEAWNEVSESLNGATGDVIRQVCDHIWRTKIHSFIKTNKDGAVKVMDHLVENDEGGFDISKFNDKKRQSFKNELQKYLNVTPSDVKESVNIHLRNMAVKSEIETAVNTYTAAKQFLRTLDQVE